MPERVRVDTGAVLRCLARASALTADLYRTATADDLRKARAGIGLELKHAQEALSGPESDEQALADAEHLEPTAALSRAIWEVTTMWLLDLIDRNPGITDRKLADELQVDRVALTAMRGALVDADLVEPIAPEFGTPRSRTWRVTERGGKLAAAVRALPDLAS